MSHRVDASVCVCTYMQDGRTSLYLAAYNGHIEIVQHLLSSSADVNKAAKVKVRLHWLW